MIPGRYRTWWARDLCDVLIYEDGSLSIMRTRRSAVDGQLGQHWMSASGGWGTVVAGAIPLGSWVGLGVLGVMVQHPLIALALVAHAFLWPVELAAGLAIGIRLMPKPLYVAERHGGELRPLSLGERERSVSPAYLGHLIDAQSLRRRFAKREEARSKLVVGALVAGIVGMAGILYLVYAGGG